jgi:hypothetical protein
MKRFSKFAAIAAFAMVSFAAHADLVIDHFTTDQFVQDNSSGIGNVSNGAVWAPEVMLGAAETGLTAPVYRNLVADKFGLSGSVNKGVAVDVDSGTNRLGFSQDADQWGQGHAIWSGQSGGGYGSSILNLLDIDPASSFNFTYRSDGPLQVDIIITDTDGNSTTATIFTLDTNGAFFADSVGFGEFDFTGLTSFDIGSIEIFINVNSTQATADIDLTFTPIRNVPEPGSIALAGLALLAVAARRRRIVR